jgi:hypothetical protein
MKCLYITPFRPSLQSGGEITVYNNLNILSRIFNRIDYIGLKSNYLINDKINVISEIDNINFLEKIKSYFYFASASSVISKFLKEIKKLDLKSYDLIFVESTRFGCLVKYLYSYNKNIIVNMHNLELFYFKDARDKLSYFLIKNKIYKSEKFSFDYSKKILYLTENEKKSIKKYYNVDGKKFIWNPVTYKDIFGIQYNANIRDYILVTANFKYKPNIKSIKVLDKIKNFNIIVAGKDVQKLNLNNKNIRLIESPTNDQMDHLMKNAKIFLSNVQSGAGMKVKIVEAMAYALPIISHKNSLHGYEKVKGIFSYNSEKELLNFLEKLDIDRLNLMSKKNYESFRKYYSYEVVENRYRKLI